MSVIWTPEALLDRSEIWDYIASDSPVAAVKFVEVFNNAAAVLNEHP